MDNMSTNQKQAQSKLRQNFEDVLRAAELAGFSEEQVAKLFSESMQKTFGSNAALSPDEAIPSDEETQPVEEPLHDGSHPYDFGESGILHIPQDDGSKAPVAIIQNQDGSRTCPALPDKESSKSGGDLDARAVARTLDKVVGILGYSPDHLMVSDNENIVRVPYLRETEEGLEVFKVSGDPPREVVEDLIDGAFPIHEETFQSNAVRETGTPSEDSGTSDDGTPQEVARLGDRIYQVPGGYVAYNGRDIRGASGTHVKVNEDTDLEDLNWDEVGIDPYSGSGLDRDDGDTVGALWARENYPEFDG